MVVGCAEQNPHPRWSALADKTSPPQVDHASQKEFGVGHYHIGPLPSQTRTSGGARPDGRVVEVEGLKTVSGATQANSANGVPANNGACTRPPNNCCWNWHIEHSRCGEWSLSDVGDSFASLKAEPTG